MIDWQKLFDDPAVRDKALHDLSKHAKGTLVRSYSDHFILTDTLSRTEIPGGIYLCGETWTPEFGLLTEAMKLKRKQITAKYEKQIKEIYQVDEENKKK